MNDSPLPHTSEARCCKKCKCHLKNKSWCRLGGNCCDRTCPCHSQEKAKEESWKLPKQVADEIDYLVTYAQGEEDKARLRSIFENQVRTLLQQRDRELAGKVEGMIQNEGHETSKTDIGANWAFLKVLELLTTK